MKLKRCRDCVAYKKEKFSPLGFCKVWGEWPHENEPQCGLEGKSVKSLKKAREERAQ